MRRTLPIILSIISVIAIQTISFAQEQPLDPEDLADDASPVSKAARLRFVDGEVSFLRAGTNDWSPAVENLPLLAGDQVYAGPDGRAEIQLSRGTYVRLLRETTLTITELSDTVSQFELTEGTALVKIDDLASADYRFEIDTPNSALVLNTSGLYEVNVADRQRSELVVSRGTAEVSTDDGTVKVREGFRLTVDNGSSGQLELAAARGREWWNEDWDSASNPAVSQSSDYVPDDVVTYESNYSSFYGASDLAGYGAWTNNATYGYCWVPRVGSDWAPYRYGRWLWIPNAGWTWLADERWGWAPYHYGRWDFIPGVGWAWIPGFGSGRRSFGSWDYRWRPSLVYFFSYPTNRGNYVGWYPLSPRDRWHRPEWYRAHNDHGRLQYPGAQDGRNRPGGGRRWINPSRPGDVTAVPVEAFQRPTRSNRDREIAGRDSFTRRDRIAKPGLPTITPGPSVDDRKAGRRALAPPIEVLGRSVVTRHRPANGDAEASAPRERRLIAPRPVPVVTDETIRGSRNGNADERRGNRDASRAGSRENSDGRARRENGKSRITLPNPADKVSNGRRNDRNTQNVDESSNQRRTEREERRRPPEQQPQVVTPPQSQNRVAQPASRVEHRETPKDKNESRIERKQERQERREARQEKRAESGARRKP